MCGTRAAWLCGFSGGGLGSFFPLRIRCLAFCLLCVLFVCGLCAWVVLLRMCWAARLCVALMMHVVDCGVGARLCGGALGDGAARLGVGQCSLQLVRPL